MIPTLEQIVAQSPREVGQLLTKYKELGSDPPTALALARALANHGENGLCEELYNLVYPSPLKVSPKYQDFKNHLVDQVSKYFQADDQPKGKGPWIVGSLILFGIVVAVILWMRKQKQTVIES